MVVGLPKEIKDNEYRVGLTPGAAASLVRQGHRVLVQQGAGLGSACPDDEYRQAGAELVGSAADAWSADLVVKVKEPIEPEYGFLRPDLLLFTFLHLAADRRLTRELLDRGVTAIAYETVQTAAGALPLLQPMSEVAGRMATQVGAACLEKPHGGRGVLLGGVPGVPPATVVVLGGGTVGANAARIALGMGAAVTLLDINPARLVYLDDLYQGRLHTCLSTAHAVEEVLGEADLVIGAVLVPGSRAPRLVTRAMLSRMRPDAVIVDVAVDQGGCVETTHPTTHSDPTYVVDGILHYAVANMPGAVPRTSTFALNNRTLPYALHLADSGLQALRNDAVLRAGLNTFRGQVTHPAVAAAFDLPQVPPDVALAG